MRQRTLPVILAMLITFALAATAFGEGKSQAPDAYSPEPSFTFENAVEGQEVTHDFIIRNRGGADLTIARVKTG